MLNALYKNVGGLDKNDDDVKRLNTRVGKPSGKFQTFQDVSLQCDIIYMPNDHGYKYALTCVELKSRICDIEPLKEMVKN